MFFSRKLWKHLEMCSRTPRVPCGVCSPCARKTHPGTGTVRCQKGSAVSEILCPCPVEGPSSRSCAKPRAASTACVPIMAAHGRAHASTEVL